MLGSLVGYPLIYTMGLSNHSHCAAVVLVPAVSLLCVGCVSYNCIPLVSSDRALNLGKPRGSRFNLVFILVLETFSGRTGTPVIAKPAPRVIYYTLPRQKKPNSEK